MPYGQRFVNNTIVGLGGTLESQNLYNELDYQDVGTLIEDNADPTLINNLIVNFEEAIVTDLSSNRVVLGGVVFSRERREYAQHQSGRLLADCPAGCTDVRRPGTG